jgi:hypothetical protein
VSLVHETLHGRSLPFAPEDHSVDVHGRILASFNEAVRKVAVVSDAPTDTWVGDLEEHSSEPSDGKDHLLGGNLLEQRIVGIQQTARDELLLLIFLVSDG